MFSIRMTVGANSRGRLDQKVLRQNGARVALTLRRTFANGNGHAERLCAKRRTQRKHGRGLDAPAEWLFWTRTTGQGVWDEQVARSG